VGTSCLQSMHKPRGLDDFLSMTYVPVILVGTIGFGSEVLHFNNYNL